MNFVYFPILNGEPSFDVPRKCLARLRVTGVLEVVVTDRKLGI
jgi:hypothetical protein